MIRIHPHLNWRKISPDHDGFHYFFGYYDRIPWNPEGNLHLALRVAQCLRTPVIGEFAQIGLLDGSGTFRHCTETSAWCMQQGCMQQFLPARKNCFIYNDFDAAQNKHVARIFELERGIVDTFDRPIYGLSPDGRHGVSLNIDRIPRHGYRYGNIDIPFEERHPADPDSDGIFLIDLNDGKAKLIVRYRTMFERHPWAYSLDRLYVWCDHAIFNCDSSRLLWLFRQSENPINVNQAFWSTFLYTSNLTGEDAECVLADSFWRERISHQIWGRIPREIMVDADWRYAGPEIVVFDESRRPFIAERIASGNGGRMHLVCSPDGNYILADSYPSKHGWQTLHLVESKTGKQALLGTFCHQQPKDTSIDVRCDLHPRWSPDGRRVTVDSIHDGQRSVWMLELDAAKQILR